MIPYGKQEITEDDIQSVIDVLQSDFITQGDKVPAFEKAVTSYCGAKFGVACNSATSALHLACLALDVGPGDQVWTTPVTFVASANAAIYCGASVDFVDIDPITYNLDPQQLESKLIGAAQTGNLPKAVVVVHLCGQSCDMAAIHSLAEQYDFKLIEDASHAIGGSYNGHKIGSCRYSDITIFSFHPVKIITTAEGGLATTNNPDLAKRMLRLRSHGVTRAPDEMTQEPDGPWYYQQVELGFNYRLTDIQAALGISQLQRLDEVIALRHQLANRYNEKLADLPVITPVCSPGVISAFHLYVIRLNPTQESRHKQIFESLRQQQIGVNLHYIPIYKQPYYQQFGYNAKDFPIAEMYYASAITLPLFHSMTYQEQDRVIAALEIALSATIA